MVMDVDTFADEPAGERQRAQRELAEQILRDNQWRVVVVPRGMGVSEAWTALEQLGSGGLMRPEDRNGIAVMISVILATSPFCR